MNTQEQTPKKGTAQQLHWQASLLLFTCSIFALSVFFDSAGSSWTATGYTIPDFVNSQSLASREGTVKSWCSQCCPVKAYGAPAQQSHWHAQCQRQCHA